MSRDRKLVFAFATLAGLAVSPVMAQEPPPAPVETPRCGGLLCDLGLFGGAGTARTALPCNDFLCRSMGGSRPAEAAPPPVAAPEPMTDKKNMPEKKSVVQSRKRHGVAAKKEAAQTMPAPTEKK